MTPVLVFTVISLYFLLLVAISFWTSKSSSNQTFFTGDRASPWYLVAFGMIGASLSGVTFISVPGWVKSSGLSYMQMVFGYLVGYFVIATVLIPLYYRLNLTSIYTYLDKRYGKNAYLTGSAYFLLSRSIGAAFRLYIVASVLQMAFFDAFEIPFGITVAVTVMLIWLYTFRSGIKTIVWTDTLQTAFMLSAAAITVFVIKSELDFSWHELFATVHSHTYSQMFVWDFQSASFFGKQFMAGAFMAIVMTGLDQDMMQKNLTCKNIFDAQKNMFWMSIALVPVNLLFLLLGILLYVYAELNGIVLPDKGDLLYPTLAINHFGLLAGVVFLLGIIAAAFSSADSALTALTTAFCVDFLKFDTTNSPSSKRWQRLGVHVGFSILIFVLIIAFRLLNNDSVISAVFTAAGYTYGPLLGLYAFGLFTHYQTRDKIIPVIAIASPILTYLIRLFSDKLLGGYQIGFELLLINGGLSFLGLWLFRKPGYFAIEELRRGKSNTKEV